MSDRSGGLGALLLLLLVGFQKLLAADLQTAVTISCTCSTSGMTSSVHKMR
jgi:hypothetical protein